MKYSALQIRRWWCLNQEQLHMYDERGERRQTVPKLESA